MNLLAALLAASNATSAVFHTPTFVGSTADAFDVTTGFSFPISDASGAQAGDFAIVAIAQSGASDISMSGLVTSAGAGAWPLVAELYANEGLGGGDANLAVFATFLDATDISGADIDVGTVGSNAGDGGVYAMVVYRDVDTGTPEDATATTSTGLNASTIDPPAITPANANTVIVVIGMCATALGGGTISSIGTNLDQMRATDNGAGLARATSLGIADKSQAVATAVNPGAWTMTATTTSDSHAEVTMALRGLFY